MIGNSMHCVLRADASLHLGGGHIYRCLTLADELSRNDWSCTFAVRPESLNIVKHLSRCGHDILLLGCPVIEEAAVMKEQRPQGCDLLVIDHYERGFSFESSLSSWASRVLVIEDLLNREHRCDVLLDQTHLARDVGSFSALSLVGPQYALLRSSFARRRASARIRRRDGPNRILIQVGASDPTELAPPLLALALSVFPSSSIDVALGQSSPSLGATAELAQRNSRRAKLHINALNMDELMDAADLMIGAAGSSCWEACCLGLPMALIQIADNQQPVIEQLSKLGAAISLGSRASLEPTGVGQTLRRQFDSAKLLEGMSASASRLCDGLGVYRSVCAIIPERARANGVVRLRPVNLKDSRIIYDWQVHPTTRTYFRNPSPPSLPEHEAWFQSRLANDAGPYSMILLNEKPVGFVRLDRHEDERRLDDHRSAFDVSIAIAPDMRGQGVATAALRTCAKLVPFADLFAYVDARNIASQGAFASSGFQELGDGWLLKKARTP